VPLRTGCASSIGPLVEALTRHVRSKADCRAPSKISKLLARDSYVPVEDVTGRAEDHMVAADLLLVMLFALAFGGDGRIYGDHNGIDRRDSKR